LKNPNELVVRPRTGDPTTALVYVGHREHSDGVSDAGGALILAHGAGAGQRSAFMVDFGTALSALGIDVVTFNFPYAEQGRKIPDRAPVLEACYRAVILACRAELASARRLLCIGGKSMGGRVATQVAAADSSLPIGGLVLLGYPLHPPGKPDQKRDKHLPAVGRPMLFVQGTRDAFGTPDELTPIVRALQPPPTLNPVPQGDHSFKLPRKDPAAQAAVYAAIQRAIAAWIRALAP
jgi:predicted alpha/beta-hydrolase family hydrolase